MYTECPDVWSLLQIHEKVWIAVRVLATRKDGIVVRVTDAYTNLRKIKPEQLANDKQRDLLAKINSGVAHFKEVARNPQNETLSELYEGIARNICDLHAEITKYRLNPQA